MWKGVWQDLRSLFKSPILLLLIISLITLIVTFVLLPILKVVSYAQFEHYMKLFTYHRWTQAGLHSLWMTLVSTLSCVIVAYIFAYSIARLEVPFKGLFRFITILPIVSPPFIVGLSYILLFGRQGIISKQIFNLNLDIYGWTGLWFVQTITFFPFAFAVIYGVLKTNSTSLEYAAYNMGASHWRVFKDVVLPLSKPGIAGGALISAMSILADFGNPMIIGGNYTVLPSEAYMQMSGWYDLSAAAALSTALFVPALLLFLVNRLWVGKQSYTTVTGKDSTSVLYPIPSYAKWLLFSFCMLFTLLVVLVYGVLFYGAFTKTWGYDWSFTLKNIDYVFAKGREIYNSIKFAFIASIGAALLSLPLAYIVQRKAIGINKLLDFLAVLPGAVPGVFLGLGFAIAFNEPPLELSGTGYIIVLALLFWNLPTCYSATLAGLQQIGPALEEASYNLGAGHIQTIRKILLPLLTAPFFNGIVVSFLRSVTCLSVVIFIYAANTSVGTISIMGLVQSGEWGKASAFTIVLIVIAFAVLGVSQLVINMIFKQKRRIL